MSAELPLTSKLSVRQGQEVETRATLIYANGLAAQSSPLVGKVGQQPE
jgi:hypothetical protein